MVEDYFRTLSKDDEAQVMEEGASQMSDKLSFHDLVDLDSLHNRAKSVVQRILIDRRYDANIELVAEIAEKLVAHVTGLEFLLPLFKRNDISNIFINPDGTLRIQCKGKQGYETLREKLDPREIDRVNEALLRTSGRALTEATPSVDCKLPRIDSLPGLKGGARVKLIHPIIATGKYELPSISIRLYETSPVLPQRIVDWNMVPANVLEKILEWIGRKTRVLVIGGTNTGKTTLLSALCNGGIHQDARIVKIEDPEEIWLNHNHVVTLEARPAPPGSSVPPYKIKDGVDDAMRMSPDWLIVGEVRTGDAALTLFRAQMSDHPGLSTFHAETPEFAIYRMGNLLISDTQESNMDNARSTFAMAVDMIIQVGWLQNRRQILGVWEVGKELIAGQVTIRQLYTPGKQKIEELTVR